jgi:hypothetical protein
MNRVLLLPEYDEFLLGSGPINPLEAVRPARFKPLELRGDYEQSLLAERRSDGAAPAVFSEEWTCPVLVPPQVLV